MEAAVSPVAFALVRNSLGFEFFKSNMQIETTLRVIR
jgi:hypothetical protein